MIIIYQPRQIRTIQLVATVWERADRKTNLVSLKPEKKSTIVCILMPLVITLSHIKNKTGGKKSSRQLHAMLLHSPEFLSI